MLDLTPGERRGALTLLVLLVLGTAHDLWQARQPPVGLPPIAPERGGLAAEPGGRSSAAPPVRPPEASSAPTPGLLDLNRATLSELDALPGIGPVLAGRIVAERSRLGRFRSREDLFAVPGIGPKLYARLAPLVSVGGGPSTSGASSVDPPPNRAERPIR